MPFSRSYSIPAVHGIRGAGIGNEAIPWAKAYLGSVELGLTCLHPAWGLNPRGYRHDFGTSRLDWLGQRALRAVARTVEITPEVARSTGEDDYGLAVRALAPMLGVGGRWPTAVVHSGTGGGYFAIRRAKRFLLEELLRPPHVPRDVRRVRSILEASRPLIAVHVRLGDFDQADAPEPGQFNRALPHSWYAHVIDRLDADLGGEAQFLIFADEPSAPGIRDLLCRPNVLLPPERRRPLLSDLLVMSWASALVCSVSSFSMLAAFLSERPYVWFEPHLHDHGDGWRSLWGGHADELRPHSLTARNLARARDEGDDGVGRGFAVAPDGPVSPLLLELVRGASLPEEPLTDLILQGVINHRSVRRAA